jgi:Ca2+/Na+ antiporter
MNNDLVQQYETFVLYLYIVYMITVVSYPKHIDDNDKNYISAQIKKETTVCLYNDSIVPLN